MADPPLRVATASASAPPRRRKMIDLVLLNHEYDMVMIRVKEALAHVDLMVFLQPTFRFQDGMPIGDARQAFPEALLRRHRKVRLVRVNESDISSDLAWYRQCYCRNELGRLFEQLGGGADDIALISDADEIPRAEALVELRTTMATESRTVFSLSSIHHFKLTMRCEQPSPWTVGPVAASGRVLFEVGAQASRVNDRVGCDPTAGYRASCAAVHRRSLPSASWHLSSLSGGLKGHKFKMQSNSYKISGELLRTVELESRESECEDHLGRWGRRNIRTHWSARNLPKYPDVPRYVEGALAQGYFLNYLNFTAEVRWPDFGSNVDFGGQLPARQAPPALEAEWRAVLRGAGAEAAGDAVAQVRTEALAAAGVLLLAASVAAAWQRTAIGRLASWLRLRVGESDKERGRHSLVSTSGSARQEGGDVRA